MKKRIEYTTELEQLEKLQKQGLKVDDIETACSYLQIYGYYNIVNSYKEPFIIVDENGIKKYKEGNKEKKALKS